MSGSMKGLLLAAAAALAFACRIAAPLANGRHGISRFVDDAYYYMIVARHFAEGGVPTFDGIHATNGFHPLWMLALAALYRVIGVDAPLFTQVLAVKMLEASFLALALALCLVAFQRLQKSSPLAWGFVGVALVMAWPAYFFFEQGMESTLATLVLVLALLAFIERRGALLATALALLFLARLDTSVFVIPPLVLAWLARERSLARTLRVVAPLGIVAIAYFAINFATTGHFTPVSGQLKSSFPFVTTHWSFLEEGLKALRSQGPEAIYRPPNLFVMSVVWAALVLAWAPQRRAPWAGVVGLALVMVALLVANLLLFQRWDKGVDEWYLAIPYALLGFALFATAAGAAARRAPIPGRAAQAALALVYVGVLATGAAISLRAYPTESAERIDRKTHFIVMNLIRRGEVLAATDTGGFSFWLERPFVNLDGLVNGRELQDAIRDRKLGEYLDRSNVHYLLAAFWDNDQSALTGRPIEKMYRARLFPQGVFSKDYGHYDYTVYSYLFDATSDAIRVCPGDEVYREYVGKDGIANTTIVIFRLRLPVARKSREPCEG
jgi:hypothetical protein